MVDSGCDIPKSFIDKHEIFQVPLRVMYPEKDYEDGVDIDPKMVYERFPDEIPSTSTPSLPEVLDIIDEIREQGYERIIMITISSGLSGTFNTFRLAAEEADDLEIFLFDTKNISIASGFYAIWAINRLEHGESYENIVRGLQNKIHDVKVFFYMDTLEYLRKGGRIGGVANAVGSMLRLRPIISCNEEGTYYTVSMIRGSKHAKIKLLEEAVKFGFSHRCWAVVGHGDAEEEAGKFREMLENYAKNDNILFTKQINATLAINTGPGLVGVAIFKEPFDYLDKPADE